MAEWLLWGDSSQFTKTFAIFNNYLFWIFTWREGQQQYESSNFYLWATIYVDVSSNKIRENFK